MRFITDQDTVVHSKGQDPTCCCSTDRWGHRRRHARAGQTSPNALKHLPDECDWGGLNRKWVADILYTVERVKLEKIIKDAVKARKERLEEKHNLNVEMRPEFAQALQNCMSFSSKAFLIW